MALTDDIVSYWKLNEASGDALDSVTTNDLTDTNGCGAAAGVIDGCRTFVIASSQKFTIPYNSSFQIADTSVSYFHCGWVKITSTSGTQQTVTRRSLANVGSDLNYMLRVDSGLLKLYWGASGGSFGSLSSGITMSTDTWYFFVFGYNGSTNKFFISINDGGLTESSVVTNQTVNNAVNPFNFGGTTGEYLGGAMDEVGFWKGRVPTSGEITQLYNGGAGLTYPFTGPTAVTTSRIIFG